jgi:hypothetical protein
MKLEIIGKKKEIMERLSRHGVSASLEPTRESVKRGGLFGHLMQRYDRRGPERAMIDAIPDEDSRQAAVALHNDLKALDDAEEQESEEVTDAVKIFRDMESEGRRLFREHDMSKRIAKLTAGIVDLARWVANTKAR